MTDRELLGIAGRGLGRPIHHMSGHGGRAEPVICGIHSMLNNGTIDALIVCELVGCYDEREDDDKQLERLIAALELRSAELHRVLVALWNERLDRRAAAQHGDKT